MGVFDRIGNLGKGMLGIMKSDGPTASERNESALDEELAALKAKRQIDKAKGTNDSTLDKLKKLHANGLLSDEEYAAKVAAASGLLDVPVERPADNTHETSDTGDALDDDRPIKKTL